MRCSRYLCFVVLVGSMGCEPDLGVITCPDGTVCPADLSCPAEPGGPCVADGCRGRAPGDDCRPEIGDVGGACNADGVCVPFSCGDGDVQALEACDPTAPLETCGDLDFDYGRRSCTADCRAIVSTCDFIDDRDLGLDLETVAINAVAITDGVVWAAGSNGVYRKTGQWERVLDGTWIELRAIGPDDIWAVGWTEVAHWDGVVWRTEPWSFGPWGTTEIIDGQLVIGLLSGGLVRRIGDAWVSELIVEHGFVYAIAKLGGVEVAACGFAGGDPFSGSFYTFTHLYAKQGETWQQIPFTELSTVQTIAGTSLDDFLVSGQIYPPQSPNSPLFRTVRIVTSGSNRTVTTIPGSGYIVPVGQGSLILPIEPHSHTDAADPDIVGTFYSNGIAQRVAIPGRVRLAASDGRHLIVAVGSRVLELGGTLRSPLLAIQSAAPLVTGVNVLELAGTEAGDLYALDERGIVWRVLDATTVPRAVEQVRSLVNTFGIWGTGSNYITISADRLQRFDGGAATNTTMLADQVARAVTGNASDDVMVVGEGDVPARHFDGAAWTPASDGLPANAKLRAIAATGSGFVAVGDGGLVATFAAGTWTVRDVGTTANLELVASAGESLVATGAGVAVRCDATTCVQDSLPWTPTDLSMRAGDDIVAVGADKTLHFDGGAGTRVDIQPSITPTSAPAMPRATGASGPEAILSPKRSVSGRSRRWNEAMLARTQSGRSVTRARAGPARERRPVASPTSCSASAVSSAKSGPSES